jgi:hypothetical protein
MSKVKKVAACLAVMALLGVTASSVSAERLPAGTGQPAFTGELEKQVVAHCQATIELLSGQKFPPGTFPGNIILLPNGTIKDVSPSVHHCPLAETLGI